ncbi:MAG: hypothetical protein ABR567_04750 [Myxococcales bacterium]|nr:hypothetical protein [Myxococcales bacterium]
MEWLELDPAKDGLPEARLVLHYAVQLVAAVGQSLGEKAPDDSQQSLSLGAGAWLGMPIADGALRAGLDPGQLALRLCDGAGAPLAAFPLAGHTMAEGLAFLSAELAGRTRPASTLALPQHPADFPHHPLADGAPFPAADDHGARTELAHLFADTQALLEDQAPLRLWPHHFDLACSVQLGAISLGMGVSPGEGVSGRPYWYATPWPRPPLDRLPPLAGVGTWHLEGWMGAELPLERLADGAAAQRNQLVAFFQSVRGLGSV